MAVFSARLCLGRFQEKYPDDKIPEKVIKCAEDYLKSPCVRTILAARSAARSTEWSARYTEWSAEYVWAAAMSAAWAAESAGRSAESSTRAAAMSVVCAGMSAGSAARSAIIGEVIRILEELG